MGYLEEQAKKAEALRPQTQEKDKEQTPSPPPRPRPRSQEPQTKSPRNRVTELEKENRLLRAKNSKLQRQLQQAASQAQVGKR